METSYNLPGFLLVDEISGSDDSYILSRAMRSSNGQSVLFKIPLNANEVMQTDYFVKKGLSLLKNTEHAGISRPIEVVRNHSGVPILVYEDRGEITLSSLLAFGKLDNYQTLHLAISLCDILQHFHKQKLCYRFLHPRDIWINEINKKVSIQGGEYIDSFINPPAKLNIDNMLCQDLLYISPEQTGLTGGEEDYRTDLYSLGMILYHCLTGEYPFPNQDPMELIHAHLASHPASPAQLRIDFTTSLSLIILKLLKKDPADRYQSAHGLLYDLIQLTKIHSSSDAQLFHLGSYDISENIQISQGVIARNEEEELLLDMVEEISEDGPSSKKLAIITGEAGFGKSTLLGHLLHSSILTEGFVALGEFDKWSQETPYSAIRQVFDIVIDRLLTKSSDSLSYWKRVINKALSGNGQVILEVIPSLKGVIGEQKQLPELDPFETKNRFHMVFGQFIKVIAKPEHPLIIILDNLQWIDLASLYLLDFIFDNNEIKNFLVILSGRSEEFSDNLSLKSLLKKWEQRDVLAKVIPLAEFDVDEINQLIRSIYKVDKATSKQLAEIVIQKTQGNPFFVKQFLTSLKVEDKITFEYPKFSYKNGIPTACKTESVHDWGWTFNLKEINEVKITENVVGYLQERLNKLNPKTLNLLQVASTIGTRFNLSQIAIIESLTIKQVEEDLQESIDVGILVHSPGEDLLNHFYFIHDQLQQFVYQSFSISKRNSLHHRIGNIMLSESRDLYKSDRIFLILRHLNKGIEICLSNEERLKLAQLNFQAGQKSMESAAFPTALSYFKIALQVTDNRYWKSDYSFSFQLAKQTAQVLNITGHFDEVKTLCQCIKENAQNELDALFVERVMMQAAFAQKNLNEVIKLGLYALAQLGLKLPSAPSRFQVIKSFLIISLKLRYKTQEDIAGLPIMKDARSLFIMELLNQIGFASYSCNHLLFALTTLEQISFSLKEGNAPGSINGFVTYGLILGGFLGKFNQGYQYGQLALKLLDHLKAEKVRARTSLVAYSMHHWRNVLAGTAKPLLKAIQSGVSSGDNEYAAISAQVYCANLYWRGKNLSFVSQEMEKYSNLIMNLNQETALQLHNIQFQSVLNMKEISAQSYKLNGDVYSERIKFPQYLDEKNSLALAMLLLNKMVLAYYFEKYRIAAVYMEWGEPYIKTLPGNIAVPIFLFYGTLIRIQLHRSMKFNERIKNKWKINRSMKKLKGWARLNPGNYLHKLDLVKAEFLRVFGNPEKAQRSYQKAVQGAAENNFLNEKALACELYARFCLYQTNLKQAKVQLKKAFKTYLDWGAIGKIQLLERSYCFVHSSHTVNNFEHNSSSPTAFINGENESLTNIDVRWNSVFKTTEAFAGELDLNNLLKNLLKILIENAGAEAGIIVLHRNNQLLIEAKHTREGESFLTSEVLLKDQDYAESVINYTARVRKNVLIDNAVEDDVFGSDPYILKYKPKSIICIPILKQTNLIGLVYLENNLTTGAFDQHRLTLLQHLSLQIAISIENAILYRDLEGKLHEKDILLREIHHRVKNNLQVIRSLLNLQSRAIEDPEVLSVFRESENRVRAMAIAHEKLYQSKDLSHIDFSKYAQSLSRNLLQSYRKHTGPVNCKVVAEPVFLNIETAIPCGLILNEIVSNSLKYAFTKRDRGEIMIQIREKNGEKGDSLYQLIIQDNGPGLPDDFDISKTKSLGLKLVEQLTAQIHGELTIESNPGTLFSILFKGRKSFERKTAV